MFSMKLSDVVMAVKDQLIPAAQKNPQALYMFFDIELAVYQPIVTRRRALVHFLLHSPYGGSVHTFVCERPFVCRTPIQQFDWQHTNSHDEYREGIDGPVTKIYFRMADEINEELLLRGCDKQAPAQMKSRCHIYNYLWRLVDVEYVSINQTIRVRHPNESV